MLAMQVDKAVDKAGNQFSYNRKTGASAFDVDIGGGRSNQQVGGVAPLQLMRVRGGHAKNHVSGGIRDRGLVGSEHGIIYNNISNYIYMHRPRPAQ